MKQDEALYQYLLRLGDTSLIMGQRLAEWCSRGPILEEDLALTNISLDYFGQAEGYYHHALQLTDEKITPDYLAFRRDERQYCNYLLAEVSNGNFAQTQLKIFLLSSFLEKIYSALGNSKEERLRVLAQKCVKEIKYHHRHSKAWLFRLSHGTIESASKVQEALNELWMFTDDLFQQNEIDKTIASLLNYDINEIRKSLLTDVHIFINECKCTAPAGTYMITGGINKLHTEHLGHILCEMQFLQRAYPEAHW